MSKKSTPWGMSQHCEAITDGIEFHSTSSHGGYWLSPARLQEFRLVFGEYKTFCGVACWFEEDCDWRPLVLVWPELFPKRACAYVLKTRGKNGRFGSGFWDKPKPSYFESKRFELLKFIVSEQTVSGIA